jgi:hypothetical protein
VSAQELAPIPVEDVRAALSEALARGALEAEPSLLERFLDWLAPRLDTGEVRALGDVLLALFVAVALALLLRLAYRTWLVFRAPAVHAERAAAATEADTRARLTELAAAAREARARGDLRAALRHALHALLVALGGRGDLMLEPAWTNRELVSRGRPSRAARELLEPLVRELEPKEFGRAEVAAADLERLEALLAPHLAPSGRAPGSAR